MNQEKIDKEINDLLAGEMNPFEYDNFMEALYEEALYPVATTIKEALQNNDNRLLGLTISSAVYQYWEKKAESQAVDSCMGGYL